MLWKIEVRQTRTILIGHGVAGKERAGRFPFGTCFEAKHQFSPGCVAIDEVICFGLPVRVGELKHGAAVLGGGVKYEPRALPFLSGFADPFSALRRRNAHRVQLVNRGAIKKAQLYRARSLILCHVFAPPLGETVRSGYQRMNAFGWRSNEYGVANLGQATSYGRRNSGLNLIREIVPAPTPETHPKRVRWSS
jgi:hypothetical protein